MNWSKSETKKRKRIMATCDLCDRPIEEGAPVYKASQIRDAVHDGLRPDDDPSLDVTSWLDYVEHDNTDWTLCPTCAARINQLTAPATTGLRDEPSVAATTPRRLCPTIPSGVEDRAGIDGRIKVMGWRRWARYGSSSQRWFWSPWNHHLAMALWGSADSYKVITANDLTSIADNLPPTQKDQLATTQAARKDLIKNLKKMYSLQAAHAAGIDKTEKFKGQMEIQTAQALAAEVTSEIQ